MTPNENQPTLVKCPVCNGQGTVSRPPWVAGDQPTWSDNQTTPYPCKACHGKGAVLISTQEFATYASEPMTTPEPSTLEPLTAEELDEMTARLGLGFTIETWNGPFPFGDKERHSVVFMTDDELRRLIAQARAARPSPWLLSRADAEDILSDRRIRALIDHGDLKGSAYRVELRRKVLELLWPSPPAQDGGLT